ncbi:PEP/pyruvate-binding domain-containing protein, partial [Streptomyces neyagawaensis]|uniref:PEP/pyruvate-binding domain-containing protein n=1 Tax=Streptomyces neyagawaensis TaxID=42238 RepID=UPI0023E40CB2
MAGIHDQDVSWAQRLNGALLGVHAGAVLLEEILERVGLGGGSCAFPFTLLTCFAGVMTGQYTVELGAGADAAADRIGGKGVGLLALARTGSSVPPGFVVTVDGFEALLAAPDLRRGIAEVLGKLDPFDPAGMENSSSEIRRLVCGSPMPFPVAEAVSDAYGTLCA